MAGKVGIFAVRYAQCRVDLVENIGDGSLDRRGFLAVVRQPVGAMTDDPDRQCEPRHGWMLAVCRGIRHCVPQASSLHGPARRSRTARIFFRDPCGKLRGAYIWVKYRTHEAAHARSTLSLIARSGLDQSRAESLLKRGLEGADDGELFLEYRQAEALVFDNGRLKQATYDTAQGFGLRAVKGEAVGYAHASDVSEAAIARAVEAVRAVQGGYSGSYSQAPARTNVRLYGDDNPLGAPSLRDQGEAAGRDRRLCARARIRACGRCRCRSARPGRWSRSCAPTARPIATCARWCASMSRSWRAKATGRNPAATAMAGARAISASSRPAPGRARSMTRCGRRWSISKPCRRRPARWTWCSAPAGPA